MRVTIHLQFSSVQSLSHVRLFGINRSTPGLPIHHQLPEFTQTHVHRLKLKKVGKTTRPFRYDLNQISYDYTVEVRNRFKGLDLIECLKNYGRRFVTLYRRKQSRPSPRKRNVKRKNGCLRRPYK